MKRYEVVWPDGSVSKHRTIRAARAKARRQREGDFGRLIDCDVDASGETYDCGEYGRIETGTGKIRRPGRDYRA